MDLTLAEKWDEGCGECEIRNGFIIPALIELIARNRFPIIIDLGAGTGYIAREVSQNLQHQHEWILIDRAEDRCEFAATKCSSIPALRVTNDDIFEISPNKNPDTIYLFCNTALEMELSSERLDFLSQLAKSGAGIIVCIPDTLSDVLKDLDGSGSEDFESFRNGSVELEKFDDFTGEQYPFHAHRPIEIVHQFVQRGLSLTQLHRTTVSDGQYLFWFADTKAENAA